MNALVEHVQGHTYHGRKGGIENNFRYSIDYALIDIERDQRTPFLFSRNRWNLASMMDRDHGGEVKNGRGASWVREVLDQYGVDAPGRILLCAQPRFWGHVFNPVSFWFCHDGQDDLVAVIAEVSNTYGDRHSYLCVKETGGPILGSDTITAQKIFHVSPFQPIDGTYRFRFDVTTDKIGIQINYTRENGGLIATLVGPRKPMTNASLAWSAIRRPLGSRRVQFLIHWQALKLWWKKAPFRARPLPPENDVSR